jgi:hypothetical protein
MLTAIALIIALVTILFTLTAFIIAFVLGCGSTVALLFAVKKAAVAVGVSEKVCKPPGEDEERQPEGDEQQLTAQKQWENLFAYDGKPQTDKDVKNDGD